MSYPVRVVVKQSISETIGSDDEIRLVLCDDPIYRRPGACDLIAAKLEERGWEGDETGTVFTKVLEDGVEAVWDMTERQVTLRASAEQVVEREETLTRHGDAWNPDDVAAQKEELQKRTEEELAARLNISDKERDAVRAGLQAQIAAKLEAHVEGVQQEVAAVQEDFYKDWIKQEAGKLGNVTSVHESESNDGDVYELTIMIDQ